MARKTDEVAVEGDEEVAVESERQGPRQTVRRMPPDTNIGPFFPSGMSAPEAFLAGATGRMEDQEAVVEGED